MRLPEPLGNATFSAGSDAGVATEERAGFASMHPVAARRPAVANVTIAH
jgi:hypothetical protein